MDGTLLDSMPIWEHASERYLQNKGITVEENLAEILFSMSMRNGAAYVKRNYKLPEDIDVIVAGVNEIVSEFYRTEAFPKPGVFRAACKEKCADGCGNLHRPPSGGSGTETERFSLLFPKDIYLHGGRGRKDKAGHFSCSKGIPWHDGRGNMGV